MWHFIYKRAIRHTRERERGGCIFQRRAELNEQQKAKSSVRGEGLDGDGELDVITTCLLFVRTVQCKSCNIRIIHGMYAASRSAGKLWEKRRRGSKVRSDTRVFSPCQGRHKYAVEIEGLRVGLARARDEEAKREGKDNRLTLA